MGAHLTTTRDVFDALGGTTRVSELTGARYSAAHNWLTDGFPSRTYLVLTQALAWQGFTADPDLWGMTKKAHGGKRPSKRGQDRHAKEPVQVAQAVRQRPRS
jgi:hypothetical protein